jgi:hypothetical protein
VIEEDLASSLVTFTPRGSLIAFSHNAVAAIEMRGGEPVQTHRRIWQELPVAIAAGPERDQVIVVYRDATWAILEFEEKR